MCTKLYNLFWDLLYSAVGNSSLSHAPRSKIRTTAEIPLKKGQQAAEKTTFLRVLCCFCKLSSVATVRLQRKDIVKFHVVFRDFFVGTKHNF